MGGCWGGSGGEGPRAASSWRAAMQHSGRGRGRGAEVERRGRHGAVLQAAHQRTLLLESERERRLLDGRCAPAPGMRCRAQMCRRSEGGEADAMGQDRLNRHVGCASPNAGVPFAASCRRRRR